MYNKAIFTAVLFLSLIQPQSYAADTSNDRALVKEAYKLWKDQLTDLSKIEKHSLLVKLRAIIRKTQGAKIFPFVFIFSGFFDFLLIGPNYITFSVWIYLGISGMILFVIEDYIIKTNKK